MANFRNEVDVFCAQSKRTDGILNWTNNRNGTGVSAYWLLATDTGLTGHRLHVLYYPLLPYVCFTVMVEFLWKDREIPVFRLNIDTQHHIHINRPPRPTGVPPFVTGNREYLWRLNRLTFDPWTMPGLPYALSLRPQGMSLPSAIRHLAHAANIDVTNSDLPERPIRQTLI